ncbi:hypothetical protein EWM64_g1571, partial [Hericium alpestre]
MLDFDTTAKTRRDAITADVKASSAFKETMELLESRLVELTSLLNMKTVPFYSLRYSAHMLYDPTLPAIIGYLSTVLFNPNNVTIECSPLTTYLELEVGQQFCKMFGFNIDPKDEQGRPVGWGHIACGGTVANLESVWAVQTCVGETKLLKDLSVWEMLNLKSGTILDIPTRLYHEFGITSSFLESVLSKFIIQSVSKDALERRWEIEKTPQIFVANTKHYSWPKAAALAGIGSDNVVNVPVDIYARINVDDLRRLLEDRLKNQQAVYAVVAVMGTTEEGAVDPLSDIIALRDEFLEKGLAFIVHADAAWGGYFSTMVGPELKAPRSYVPRVGLRTETEKQLRHLQNVDSITVDPHKTGYVPYPAGGLCYRDGRMRFLLTWSAPYINAGAESIGVYGVEGSKPGAAVWLSHDVIGLNDEGYGSLLGQVSFTCRRFSSHWATMSTPDTDFTVVPFNPLPAELNPDSTPEKVNAQKQFIRDHILLQDNFRLEQDREAMALLNELGSDLNINTFACNFRYKDGRINTDVNEANYLNKRIYERLSVTSSGEDPHEVPFYITSTVFAQADYGECATNFKKRLHLEGDEDLFVLRNVVMSPFTTTHLFIAELAGIFKQVLEEEVERVRERNTPKKAIHTFVMQGTDKLHLVHTPSFHMAGGRYQIILTADLEAQTLKYYRAAQEQYPGTSLVLRNAEPALLEDLISRGSFKANITVANGEKPLVEVKVANVAVVKQRSLRAANLFHSYPEGCMPFYLYGTEIQQHVDHVLVMAPNAQFSAANVQLSLDNKLSAEDLKTGLILRTTNVHEQSMQPFAAMKDLPQGNKFFFHDGKVFTVEIYRDAFPAKVEDPVLLPEWSDKVATGLMKLGSNLYIDMDKLNHEYHEEQIQAQSLAAGHMSTNAKAGWMKEVGKKLARNFALSRPAGLWIRGMPPHPLHNLSSAREYREDGQSLTPRTPHSKAGRAEEAFTEQELQEFGDDEHRSYSAAQQQSEPLLASSASATFPPSGFRLRGDNDEKSHASANETLRIVKWCITNVGLVLGSLLAIVLFLMVVLSFKKPDILRQAIGDSVTIAGSGSSSLPSATIAGPPKQDDAVAPAKPSSTHTSQHNASVISYENYTSFPLLPEEYRDECWKLMSGYMQHDSYWSGHKDVIHHEVEDAGKTPEGERTQICSRSMTYMLDGHVGLLADLALMAQVAALARERNATFFVDDTYWNRGKMCAHVNQVLNLAVVLLHLKIRKVRRFTPAHDISDAYRSRHWVVNSRTAKFHLGHAFSEEYEDAYSIQLNRLKPIFVRSRTSMTQTIRPNAATAALIRSARKELASLLPLTTPSSPKNIGSDDGTPSIPDPGRYIGVHIRRGDRTGLSWKYVDKYLPIEAYAEEVSNTWTRLFQDNTTDYSSAPIVYVAADDPAALEELQPLLPEHTTVFSLAGSSNSELRELASPRPYVQTDFEKLEPDERKRLTRGMVVDFALLNGLWAWDDEVV